MSNLLKTPVDIAALAREYDASMLEHGPSLVLVMAYVDALRTALTASASRPNELRFGVFVVSDTEEPGKVDIFHDSGEGGRFDRVKLGMVIAGFYGENF